MDSYKEKSLFYKAKSMVSSLYGVILWSTTLSISTPRQIIPTYSGLKTLFYSKKESSTSFILHSYMVSPSPSPSRLSSFSSSRSCMVDDLIGTDSGVYLESSETEAEKIIPPRLRNNNNNNHHHHHHGKRNQELGKMKNKYPPPIPLLSRTSGQMPWILRRHYIDGRLILVEEKVKHHEYFETYRGNGNLVMKLVQLDHTTVQCCDCDREDEIEIQDLPLMEEEDEEEEEEYEESDDDDDDLEESFSESCLDKSYSDDVEMNGNGKRIITTNSNSYLACNIASASAHQSPSGVGKLGFPAIRPMPTVVSF